LIHFLQFSENSQRHHSAADASVYLVNMKRQIYYAHRQKKYVLNQITYTVCTQNLIHFLHFLENSQRHHYAADASVYLVNIKRQIYYAHRQKKGLFFRTGVNYLPSELYSIYKSMHA
jgi:hypothetical protein